MNRLSIPEPGLPEGFQPVGTFVVDTNVILVANGQHGAVSSACAACCARWLEGLMATGRVALDDAYEILGEYQHKTHADTGQGMGDRFVRWVLHHLDNPARIDLVPLTPHAQRAYADFPDDERLSHFDASDRKFVALSRAHPERPVIWQAADCKWLDWAPALAEHGVKVVLLCEPEMHEFHLHKFGV
ncbi:MAG TPA: hypothetical protein VFH49_00730 [Aquabacterium sp.]|nr:hypothetical protein [Aquabacterium sp.]